MKKYLTGLILSLYLPVIAQTSNIDSLKNELHKHTKDDSVKVTILILIGNELAHNNPVEATAYTRQALVIAEKLKWIRGIIYTNNQLGTISQITGDFIHAIDYYHKALKETQLLKSKMGEAIIYNNLAIIYLELAQFDKALDYYNKLLVIAREEKEKEEEAMALLNIGVTYQKKENFDQSLLFLKDAEKIASENNYQQILAYTLCNTGVVLNKQKLFSEAINFFNRSNIIAVKNGDISCQSQSTVGLSESFFFLDDFKNAEAYCIRGIQLAIQSQTLGYLTEMKHLLSSIYEAQHKPSSALTTYKEYIILRDSLMNDSKNLEITKKDLQFDFERKQALVQAENERKQAITILALEKERYNRNISIAGIGLVFLSGLSGFVLYKRKRDADEQKRNAIFQAEVSDTEMKALRSQMNPHFIFNSMNAIIDYIDKHNNKTAALFATRFAKLMRMILENSERKEVSLETDLNSLDLYLQLEALRLNNKFTYEIKVDDNIDQESTLIPPLILQPFVENSIWHGLSTKENNGKILIHLFKEDTMIKCIIEDNGIGRKQAEILSQANPLKDKKSFGMKITRSRIDIINRIKKTKAAIELHDLTEGFRVEIKLPFETIF